MPELDYSSVVLGLLVVLLLVIIYVLFIQVTVYDKVDAMHLSILTFDTRARFVITESRRIKREIEAIKLARAAKLAVDAARAAAPPAAAAPASIPIIVVPVQPQPAEQEVEVPLIAGQASYLNKLFQGQSGADQSF